MVSNKLENGLRQAALKASAASMVFLFPRICGRVGFVLVVTSYLGHRFEWAIDSFQKFGY